MNHLHAFTPSDLLSNIALLMDFGLVFFAVWMALSVSKLKMGGAIRKTVTDVVIGALILGLPT